MTTYTKEYIIAELEETIEEYKCALPQDICSYVDELNPKVDLETLLDELEYIKYSLENLTL